jgi:LPXTG-motif cell wall-anchored protein
VAGLGAGAIGAIGIGVAGALYLRKRRKQNKTEEKQSST